MTSNCLQSWLGCRVRVLGLSPKFHVRFVQLFGVYGGVINTTLAEGKDESIQSGLLHEVLDDYQIDA